MKRKLLPVALVLACALAFLVSCGTTPKARYYENLDMYDFVMQKVRIAYNTSTDAEKAKMEDQLAPLLNAWSKARLVWKGSLDDATKEQAAMLAWSEARTALVLYGIITVKELDKMEEVE